MAARPKRVSMKGRGADIFFGDYESPAPPAAPAPDGHSLPRIPAEAIQT